LVGNEEHSGKGEIVYDLIRKERDRQNELLWLLAKLEKSEDGLLTEGPLAQISEELLADIKKGGTSECLIVHPPGQHPISPGNCKPSGGNPIPGPAIYSNVEMDIHLGRNHYFVP